MPRRNRSWVALSLSLPLACTPEDTVARADASMTYDAAANDAGADGVPADGNATFACGATVRCYTGRQFCHVTIPGAAGSSSLVRCGDLPAGCARCECIPEARGTSPTQCLDTTPGEISITVLRS